MAKISVTGSALAGFGVIARQPGAVLIWGVVMLILSLAPVLALIPLMGPELMKTIAALMQTRSGELDPDSISQMMQLQSGLMLIQVGGWLWGTFIKALICSAIFRAVLEPAQSRGAFLRLGPQELWLALLFLVVSVLAYIVAVLASIGVLVPALVVGLSSGPQGQGAAAGVLTGFGLAFVAVLLLIWLALRLSLAAPMTFADRQFRLFESWALTRGSTWRLLGVAVLSLLILLVLELILAGVVLSALFMAGGPPVWLSDPQAVQAFLARPPLDLLRSTWPWLAVIGLVWSVIGPGLFAIVCAPWAAAYRDLTRQPGT